MTSGERLKLFREKTGYNQTQFASFLHIPPRNWSRYEANLTNPPPEVLIELARLGLNLHWHLTGEGEMIKENKVIKHLFDRTFVPTEKVSYHPKKSFTDQPIGGTIEAGPGEGGPPADTDDLAGERDMAAVPERTEARPRMAGEIPLIYAGDERLEKGIIIPFLEDQAISAGSGADLGEGDNPTRYIRAPEYLERYPDLAMLPVRGDSMDPTLHDGDLVVCDGGGWDGDGIYVIKTEEKAFVKRVLFTPDGYQVISDNKMYPSYGVRNENMTIVGKVRAAVIMMPGRRGGI
jgi:phage repressor protein C with HTH and peptisase S24 domain